MEIRYTSAAQWADARDGVIPAPYALEAGESITKSGDKVAKYFGISKYTLYSYIDKQQEDKQNG